MAETVQASQQDGHFNESIVNEEILEDMKKNRIDHMKYLPDMEQLEESDVMDHAQSQRRRKYKGAASSGRNRTGCTDRNKETFWKQYLHVYTDLHCKLL